MLFEGLDDAEMIIKEMVQHEKRADVQERGCERLRILARVDGLLFLHLIMRSLFFS